MGVRTLISSRHEDGRLSSLDHSSHSAQRELVRSVTYAFTTGLSVQLRSAAHPHEPNGDIGQMQFLISVCAPKVHKQFTVARDVVEVGLKDGEDWAMRDRGSIEVGQHTADLVSLRFEALDDACVRVTNQTGWTLSFDGDSKFLKPRKSIDAQLPIRLCGPSVVLVAFRAIEYEELCQGCERDTDDSLGHGRADDVPQSALLTAPPPAPATLAEWFKTLGRIQRQTVCSEEFFREAVRAVVDPGGLDAGMLLKLAGDGWNIECSHLVSPAASICFEPHLAEVVRRRREPLLYQPSGLVHAESTALFAAPVFDHEMNVDFVLFGRRQCGVTNTNRRRRLRELEWLWIQLIAETLSAGFVGLSQRSTIVKQQALLERVCPSPVSSLTEVGDGELVSETREVTVMFADLVDSTRLCEQHAPRPFLRFQSELMERWSSIVEDHGGMVIDYYGDGLLAMWNAPEPQSEHALLACQAGLAISKSMSSINAAWSTRLQDTVRLGIGIHTGIANIGNAGTRNRLKYGPRGIAIHLASRIEQATRLLNQAVLISDATRQALPDDVSAYRLGQFKLRGFENPIVLHALHSMRSGEITNPCCDTQFCELQRLLNQGDLERAAGAIAKCRSCNFDELSFRYLHGELTALSADARDCLRGSEPVFDLTHD